MRPWILAVVGALLLIGSGASALGLFASSSAPEGSIAEDSITITVTEEVTRILPITGASIVMLVGLGLLLVAAGWSVARRRSSKTQELIDS